jgi:hypothetical protein
MSTPDMSEVGATARRRIPSLMLPEGPSPITVSAVFMRFRSRCLSLSRTTLAAPSATS